MITTPGVYSISHEEYHSDPAPIPSLSRSTIKDLIFQTPAHARWNHPRLNPAYQPDDGNGKFDVGLASHSLILEGIDNVVVVEADDWRTKVAKESRELARDEGKTPLLRHQFESVKNCVLRVEEQIYACKELGIKNLMADGDHEQSYFWEENGVWCRSRPDWISGDHKLILDFKFTDRSANPEFIGRHVEDMSYDLQAAWYSRGAKAIHGMLPKFIFVFCELTEPYFCSFVGLNPMFVSPGDPAGVGWIQSDYGLYLWKTCLESGEWPGYPNRPVWIDPSPWHLAKLESRLAEMGVGK